jgi:hypothetical protein
VMTETKILLIIVVLVMLSESTASRFVLRLDIYLFFSFSSTSHVSYACCYICFAKVSLSARVLGPISFLSAPLTRCVLGMNT